MTIKPFYYNFDARGQNLVLHEVVLLFTTSNGANQLTLL